MLAWMRGPTLQIKLLNTLVSHILHAGISLALLAFASIRPLQPADIDTKQRPCVFVGLLPRMLE